MLLSMRAASGNSGASWGLTIWTLFFGDILCNWDSYCLAYSFITPFPSNRILFMSCNWVSHSVSLVAQSLDSMVRVHTRHLRSADILCPEIRTSLRTWGLFQPGYLQTFEIFCRLLGEFQSVYFKGFFRFDLFTSDRVINLY